MKTIIAVLTLTLSLSAFANKPEEKKEAHNIEHQHVKSDVKEKHHEHEQAHHVEHDHLRHHKDHDSSKDVKKKK